jgi:ABC-type branched-subunit amino acid transport system ATPase component
MGAYPRSDGAIRANLERVVEFVPRLRERIAQVTGTLSFHVTPAVET